MTSNDAGRCLPGVLLLVLVALVTAIPARSGADGRRAAAHVVDVRGGDTLMARIATMRPGGLKNEETVRLVGIDCPESRAPGGSAATARLGALVLGRHVMLEIARQSRDRHGRLLAGVYLADRRTLVQKLLVREGFCRTLVIPPNLAYVDQLRAAKREAQRAARGIWAQSRGVTEDRIDHLGRDR